MSFNGIAALSPASVWTRVCMYCGRVYEQPGNCVGCGAPPKACNVPQAKPVQKGVCK